MVEQPKWAKGISADRMTTLVQEAFRKKYQVEMTPRARKLLRKVIAQELTTLHEDEGYEYGTESAEIAAERFVELTAGELKLSAKNVQPSPNSNSLDGYSRVAVVPVTKVVEKARAYHKYERRNICPVWPF